MNKLRTVMITAMFLAGCSSSTTSKVHYYVLEPAYKHAEVDVHAPAESKAQLIYLESLTVAPYLTRSQLPMQLEKHQVYYADDHLWAEPLVEGLRRSLTASLRKKGGIHIFSEKPADTRDNTITLVVHFDDFVASYESGVIANGTYSILKGPTGREVTVHRFSLRRELDADGFDSAVGQLRFLIHDLAERIYEDVKDADS